jgi:hypothetical protein
VRCDENDCEVCWRVVRACWTSEMAKSKVACELERIYSIEVTVTGQTK